MVDTVVFFDPRVPTLPELIAALPREASAVVLDDEHDGLLQIAGHLRERKNVRSIHVVSHGSPGCLTLGNQEVTSASLQRHTTSLRHIRRSLAPAGDILLYGCNVAAGEEGAAFTGKLAQATGANVAASERSTGASHLGATAGLERHVGAVRTQPLFTQATFDRLGTLLTAPIAVQPLGSTQTWIQPNIQGSASGTGFVSSSTGAQVFAFMPDTSGTYRFTVSSGTSLDSELRIFDFNGAPLTATIDNGNLGQSETITVSGTAGLFLYASVSAFVNSFTSTSGNFTLAVTGPAIPSTSISTPATTFVGSVSSAVTYQGDLNYFTLTAPAGTTTLNLSISPSPTSGLDTTALLFDSTGTLVRPAIDSAPAGGTDQALNIPIVAGQTYSLGVTGFTRTQTGNYTVNADFNPDQTSSSGTSSAPTSVTPLSGTWLKPTPQGTASTTGTISAGASSIFAFMPDANGTYSVSLAGTGGGLDPVLRIFNVNGVTLNATPIDSTGVNGTETFSGTATVGNWLYASVSSFSTTSGTFSLGVTGPAIASTSIATPATTFTGSASGAIDYLGDMDYFTITAPTGTTTLNLSVRPSTTINTFMQLYDSNGTLMQNIDTAGAGGTDSASNIAIVAGRSYSVGITTADRSGLSNPAADTYTVSADFNPDQTSTSGGAGLNLTGTAVRDTFNSTPGNDTINGAAGTDTVIFSSARSAYTFSNTSTVTVSGPDGVDTITNVERFKFSDKSVALDMGTTQSSGMTALLLGGVLGVGALAVKQPLVGIVIDLFDQGFTFQQLSGAIMRLDIWGLLANGGNPGATNTQIANYLLTTINRATPDQATLNAAVTALNTQTGASQGDFLAQLASSAANQSQVGLVGLAATGMDYVAV